jgi:hypothetical protein
LGDDLARPTSDLGLHDRAQILWTNKFVKHGNIVVQQLKPHVDLRGHVHAVLADGVVRLGRGLQTQGIDVQLVPRPNDVKPFVPQFTGVQNRTAADKAPAIKVVSVKSLPKNSDTSARDRNHDVGKQYGGQ